MCRSRDISALARRIESISLNSVEKENVKVRYLTVLKGYAERRSRYSWGFHLLRNIITVGSLIVPAILSFPYLNGSVQAETGASMSFESYLVTWILSLLVTISNGLVSLMKIEKKYYVMNTVYEQLVSEGWQYINLTGRYGQRKGEVRPTHETQAPLFTHMIEKIRMKQIEEEYFKAAQETAAGASGTGVAGTGGASGAAGAAGATGSSQQSNTSLEFTQTTPWIDRTGAVINSGATAGSTATGSSTRISNQEVNGRTSSATVSLYSPTGQQGPSGPQGPQAVLPTIVEESHSNESI